MPRRKKKKINPRYDLDAISWCFNNGYKAYPVPILPAQKTFRIVLEYKGQKKESKELYGKKEWSDKIWELYELIYDQKCPERNQKENI